MGKDLSKEAGSERVKNVFFKIEEACIAQKVESFKSNFSFNQLSVCFIIFFYIQINAPTSDFIELYTNEIAMLKRKIQALTNQNKTLSESVCMNHHFFN